MMVSLVRWAFHRWHENVAGIVEDKYNLKKADDFREAKRKKEVTVSTGSSSCSHIAKFCLN